MLILVILFAFFYATMRSFYLDFYGRLYNEGKKKGFSSKWRLLLISEILFIGTAIGYHFATDQMIIPFLLGFIPPIIFFTFRIILQYIANDGNFTENPKYRKNVKYDLYNEYYKSEEYYNLYYYGTTNKKDVERWAEKFELPPLVRKSSKTPVEDFNSEIEMPALPDLTLVTKPRVKPNKDGPQFIDDTDPMNPPSLAALEEGLKNKRKTSTYVSSSDPSKIPILKAFVNGYLTDNDYLVIGYCVADFILVVLMGIMLTAYATPRWVGGFISFVILTLIFTVEPICRYMMTYKITVSMIITSFFGGLFLLLTCLYLFDITIDFEVNSGLALLYLLALFCYPAFIFLIALLFAWFDNSMKTEKKENIVFWCCYTILFISHFFLYFYVPVLVGVIITVALILFVILRWYIIQWANNGYVLSTAIIRLSILIVVVVFSIALILSLSLSINLSYSLSSLTLLFAFSYLCDMLQVIYTRNNHQLFFSPYIFPIYSFNSKNMSLQTENHFGIDMMIFCILLEIWGCIMTALVHPIEIGLVIMSIAIVIYEIFYIYCSTQVPFKLADEVVFLGDGEIKQAINIALKEYKDRQSKLDLSENDNNENKDKLQQTHYYMSPEEEDDIKEFTCANDVAQALSNDVIDLYKYRKYIERVLTNEDGTQRHIKDEVHIKRVNGLWTLHDAISNSLYGNGPLGFISPCGIFSRLGKWYNNKVACDDRHPLRTKENLRKIIPYDNYLKYMYNEEYRSLLHFIVLLIETAHERVRKYQTSIIKLVREEKFSMIAQEIDPPIDLFKSEEYTISEVKIINEWYASLPPQKKSKFREFKKKYEDDKKIELEEIKLIENKNDKNIEELQSKRELRDKEMLNYYYEQLEERRQDLKDDNETIPENMSESDYCSIRVLDEISRGRQAILTSMYIIIYYFYRPGRQIQYCDSEFPPSEESIGSVPENSEPITGWLSAYSLNQNYKLYNGETDPSDIYEGMMHDYWLTGAISILANAPKNKKGIAYPISKLIINQEKSVTGAYIINIYKNGVYQPIIVDDYFPALSKTFQHAKCAASAMGYNANFSSIWFPLIEKAFAKYYGSYSELQNGFVHQALTMLTGCPSEEIHINDRIHNLNQIGLWGDLITNYKNGYLMGAAVMKGKTDQKSFTEHGILTNIVYPISEVVHIDGYKLIRLHYPADYNFGDMTWKGDWNKNSSLWTSKLKYKLGKKIDDNTFWMSFDDFCRSFYSLYVCYYVQNDKWIKQVVHFRWSKEDETATGLPVETNPDCDLSKAPHYRLRINRPTEVIIKLRQCDKKGNICKKLLPISLFLIQNPLDKFKEFRTKELSHSNVIEYSGKPKPEIELVIRCSLKNGLYGIVVATQNKDEEGPYQLTVYTSRKVKLMPMMTVEELINAKNKLFNVSKDKIIENVKENKLEADISSPIKKIRGPKWKEFYDEENKRKYYYDTTTGKSVWEKPSDFLVGRRITQNNN